MTDGETVKPKVWTLEAIVADPEGWHRSTLDEIRRENPQMTDEQIEDAWQFAKAQFGL